VLEFIPSFARQRDAIDLGDGGAKISERDQRILEPIRAAYGKFCTHQFFGKAVGRNPASPRLFSQELIGLRTEANRIRAG
jgi:hypothetical protein